MNNSKQMSILGCGWLGLPLGKKLVASGYQVKGSIRQEKKIFGLKNAGIQAYLLGIGAEKIKGDFAQFLEGTEILIIAIPPGLRKQPAENFVDKIKAILPHIEQSDVKKVLFISSTSVYADDNTIVAEDTIPLPETESGKQLLATEQLLKSNNHFQTTILRFGGLIGSDRHPINFLAGKKDLKNPDAPVNLIHLDDCIHIIRKIIEENIWNETFNAVAPFHPTREEYYTDQAKSKGLKIPVFIQNIPIQGKTVSSQKVQDVLKYRFIRNVL
ncbi:epimerase [Arachidicoccus ginsenosidivorans]|uniref:SDR family oxidoreductase n=1 Tax=Arachidicoccus ginsenosidivorans TaxID=496057 RepID=A0A5B8VUP4_9BACT|nr:SDR family oxidoreductase [Arachidicoccus ginsenosidivorans]QEC73878.1 SDR family oxidoreductase [Arachidicoccus ginsenosidivorans]